jgi:hypothetical protein
MFTMMQTQTALLDRLRPRAAGDGEDAIGSILGGGDELGDAGLKLPGAKGAAAREAFRQEVRKRPLNVARSIYRNVAGSMDWEPLAATAQSGNRVSMRAYFTQRVAFGSYKTLAYMGFAVATAWDWLMEGDPSAVEHVKALLGLTCAAVEQVTLDAGNWTMAAQFMCLPEPPWAYISRSAVGFQRAPFSELADPRWSAAIMGYLKDVEALRGQRRATGGGEEAPAPKKPAKGQEKGGAGRGAAAAAASAP